MARHNGLLIAGAIVATTAAVVVLAQRASAAPPGELAQVTGQVTDADSSPLDGVTVTLGAIKTSTDADGVYTFYDIAPGAYPMRFAKDGYETVTL